MDFGEFDVLFRLGSTRILPGRSRKSLLKPRQERPVAQIRSTSACAPLSRKTQARWTSSRHSALMSSRHIGPLVPFSTTQNMSIRHLQTTNSNMVIGLKRRISLKFFMICSPSCLAFAKKSLITSWRRRLRGHSQSGCPSMLRVPSLPRLMPGYGARRLICSMWGEMQFQRQRQHGWNPRFKEHRLYAIMRLSMSSLRGAPPTGKWPALARAWQDGRQLAWTRPLTAARSLKLLRGVQTVDQVARQAARQVAGSTTQTRAQQTGRQGTRRPLRCHRATLRRPRSLHRLRLARSVRILVQARERRTGIEFPKRSPLRCWVHQCHLLRRGSQRRRRMMYGGHSHHRTVHQCQSEERTARKAWSHLLLLQQPWLLLPAPLLHLLRQQFPCHLQGAILVSSCLESNVLAPNCPPAAAALRCQEVVVLHRRHRRKNPQHCRSAGRALPTWPSRRRKTASRGCSGRRARATRCRMRCEVWPGAQTQQIAALSPHPVTSLT
mmetsp:Transcript_106496/g.193733  ORF Transcript_106496/g.193733 Transcript_106496/m.193733 type:complete len:494 (-) Transcript_106496:449-1930(-)